MRSANSFFNLPLYRKQMRRFWPLWVLYSILWIIIMPVYLLAQYSFSYRNTYNASEFNSLPDVTGFQYEFSNYVGTLGDAVSVWILFVFCAFVAMAVWSYLYQARSVSLIHSLAPKRSTLFITNYLVGLSCIVIPVLITAAVTFLVGLATGLSDFGALGFWMLVHVLVGIFFFSFATFWGFVTGQLLSLPVLYVIFSFLVIVLSSMAQAVMEMLVYGYAYGSLAWLNDLSMWLTPSVQLMESLYYNVSTDFVAGSQVLTVDIRGLDHALIYAVIGLILTGISYYLYRIRQLERAGDAIVFAPVRPAFSTLASITAGLLTGVGISAMLGMDNAALGLFGYACIGIVIGYLAAEMFQQKTFRIGQRSLLMGLIPLGLVAFFVMGNEADLFGYERKVPAVESVSAIYLDDGAAVTDPAQIALVTEMHALLIAHKREIEAHAYMPVSSYDIPGAEVLYTDEASADPVPPTIAEYIDYQDYTTEHVTLRYELGSGSVVERDYRIPVTQELLDEEGGFANILETLLSNPEWLAASYIPPILDGVLPDEARVFLPDDVEMVEHYYDEYGDEFVDTASISDEMTLIGTDAHTLYAAVWADLAAGRIGVDPLLHNEAYYQNYYVNSIYFTIPVDYNGEDEPIWVENNTFGYVNYYGYPDEDGHTKKGYLYEVDFRITKSATSTLAALEKLGITEANGLRTEYDDQMISYAERYAED